MAGKRRFGRVRRLPSGRWQTRYKGPDEIDRPAPDTFATKGDAGRWLSLTEADITKDNWLDPDIGRVLFADYARAWIAERPNLRPKTLQLYEGLVRLHLVPDLGSRVGGHHRPANPALAQEPARPRRSCCPMSLSTWSSSPALLAISSSSPARKGAQLWRSNFTRQWRKALEVAG